MDWNKHLIGVCTLISLAWCHTEALQGQERAGSPEKENTRESAGFLRVEYDDQENPVALQTAIARYRLPGGEGGLAVDLIGAVHIGEKSYYRTLNQLFSKYDAVLYELVTAEGEELPDPQMSGSPMHMIHQVMQSMLGLSSQLEEVDYTSDNFVHADMSPQEMSEAMKARGDNAVTFALSALADVLRQANLQAQEMANEPEQPSMSQEDVFSLLTGRGGGADLKRQMALQFDRMGATEHALGPTIGRLLVSDRNSAAMKVFRRELAKGRKRIAIFYGAAHMPDFASRLVNDFGLEHAETKWLTAWDLTVSEDAGQDSPFTTFLKLLQTN